MSSSFLTGACLLFAAALGNAQDYYVDVVNGDDANGGQSWSDAWKTIRHAALSTAPGANIHIAPGLYDASSGEVFPIAHLDKSFLGAGPDATVVDGGGAARIFQAANSAGDARIEGLWLRNAGVGVFTDTDWSAGNTSLVLRDLRVSGMSVAGIDATSWTDWIDVHLEVRLERARIEDCAVGLELGAVGILGHPTDPPTAFAHLTCVDSLFSDNGVGIRGGEHGESDNCTLTVERCTIVGSAGTGVSACPGAFGSVRNSILFDNAADVACGVGLQWSCTELGPFPGPGNIAGDPLFNDPAAGDWRLRFGSPCIDAAEPDPGHADLAGTPRQVDGDLDLEHAPDMGALELTPLVLRDEPRIGTSLALELWGPAAGDATVFATLAPTGPRRWTPYGWALLVPPLRNLGTHPVQPGPPAILALRIPDDAALIGQVLSLQALTSSTDAPAGRAWTNAIERTILP